MSLLLPLEIDPEAAQALLAEMPAGLVLADVREPDEHAICRLEGATLLPLTTFADTARERLPERGARILLYCHHGMRSLRAAEYLRSLGYENAQSITGGIDRWSQEIDPEVPRY